MLVEKQVSEHWVDAALLRIFDWKLTTNLGDNIHMNLKKEEEYRVQPSLL